MTEGAVVFLVAVVFALGFASGMFWGEMTERRRGHRAYPKTRLDLVVYRDEPYKSVRLIPPSKD